MRVIGKAALLAALILPGGAALATGLSVNHERLPPGTALAVCVQRATVAIAATGMQPLNTTTSAAWGISP